MPPLISSLLKPSQPEKPVAANNSWHHYVPSNTVFVFVHGVLSDALECWFNASNGAYWPSLVAGDVQNFPVPIFNGGYYTSKLSTHYAVPDCAKELFDALHDRLPDPRPGSNGRLLPPAASHDRIVFVCHSLGGIVVRHMLTNFPEAFRTRKIGLVLVASPSMGSQYGTWLRYLAQALRNETAQTLQFHSEDLTKLDYQFQQHLKTLPAGSLYGMELAEHHMIVPGFLSKAGALLRIVAPPVVPRGSALRYFEDSAIVIPETDHSTIVKPRGIDHGSHINLRRFYAKFNEKMPSTAAPPVAPGQGATVAPEGKFECRDVFWQIDISEDGDASNRMEFLAISAAKDVRGGAPKYQLPEVIIAPGQTTDFYKDEDASSTGVLLKGNTITFESPPTPENSFDVVLQQGDVSAYSMDASELSRNDPNGGGYDYVEKKLPFEKAGRLAMQIHFPASLQIEKVDAQGFRLIGNGSEGATYDHQLTTDARRGFLYSRLLDSATLVLQNPAPRSVFRIRWTLAEPAELPAEKAAFLHARRRRLLKIRSQFESGQPPKAALEALGDFANVVLQQLPSDIQPHILTGQLDVSLMAVDGEDSQKGEVLRVCTCLNDHESYWALELPIGRGIAGRAARSLRPRLFAPSTSPKARTAAEDMVRRAYQPFAEQLRHRWLLCIPLWEPQRCHRAIGVVNFGTFDSSQAQYLRPLGDETTVAKLVAYASEALLKRL
ncbi:MAG: hypothetical protein JST65_09090 [Acidobacteria bacterium]|nr:hypothetical protein [Acidobacteriota bacterium]